MCMYKLLTEKTDPRSQKDVHMDEINMHDNQISYGAATTSILHTEHNLWISKLYST